MRLGMMLVAVAGPLSNMAIALLCTVILGLLYRFRPDCWSTTRAARGCSYSWLTLNVVLAIFNLLPDSAAGRQPDRRRLIPYSLRRPWENFCRMGPIALAAVIVLPTMLGVSLLGGPVAWVTSWLDVLLNWVAG